MPQTAAPTDQIQQQQMHRVKEIKEVFDVPTPFSVIQRNRQEGNDRRQLPPEKGKTARHNLPDTFFSKQIQHHNTPNTSAAVVR